MVGCISDKVHESRYSFKRHLEQKTISVSKEAIRQVIRENGSFQQPSKE
jgi:hypothetical protein